MILSLYFDGSCEPVNPGGIATAGWILKGDGGKVIDSAALFVCEGAKATNNVAEYSALLAGLKQACSFLSAGDALVIFGDSKLVINQLTGSWRINKDHLRKLRDECIQVIGDIPFQAEWIEREKNHEADALSQKAYVEKTGKPYPMRGRRP